MKSILILTSFLFVLFSCNTQVTLPIEGSPDHIRINQLGYYPQSQKEFVVVDTDAESFKIVDEQGMVHFKGKLKDQGTWESSGERVLLGDFSKIDAPGKYMIIIEPDQVSYPFEIKEEVNLAALNASIKSYYFQRASMPIEEQYGGAYHRGSGHPDDNCPFHPSTGKVNGTLYSPGGWYDAGDYGKYIGNAAITTGQMMNILEIYPESVTDGQLEIPESGNGIGDLLDEIRYELDWMLTMQDEDGGVFHKLTAKNFGGFIMPEEYDLKRFIIGKGTTASLNFAASMAQAFRIYSNIDPEWATTILSSSEKAWEWSVAHPDTPFRNPEDVSTGEYGDDQFSDDFYWAAAELYVSTGKEVYMDYLMKNEESYIHQITNSWKFFIRNMGFHTLLANKEKVDPALFKSLTEKHMDLADEILEKIESIPYHMGIDHFEWGSNSDVLNQAMILCYAHHLTGEQKYLNGAISNVDYIFGKNATGFSFLTGYGSKQVMNPHHRPSGADRIKDPVPGFIVGGPNKDKQDRKETEYASDYPAKSFADVQPSYASNEVCLNWNAPAVFVLVYLEQVY